MIATPLFPDTGPAVSPLRPSIFELLAEEQLRELFHPVVRYVLSYFAQRYPRCLLRILNHHEEVFAALLLLVEQHHLRKHNASLSENFYRLRLAPASPIPTPRLEAYEGARARRLSRRQRWGMLLILVGLPYLRAKAQGYFESLGGRAEGEEEADRTLTRAQKLYMRLYPLVNLAFDLTLLGYDVAYLFDRTSTFRPWHAWLGMRIQRQSPDDELPTSSTSTSTSIFNKLPPLLPPLLLLLKLSQWWYSPSSPRSVNLATQTSSKVHHLVPPPKPLPILPSSDILPSPTTPPLSPTSNQPEVAVEVEGVQRDRGPDDSRDRPVGSEAEAEAEAEADAKVAYTISKEDFGKCPLCRRKWQNPAVLPSGWVVCWRCGWDAIEASEGLDEGEAGSPTMNGMNGMNGTHAGGHGGTGHTSNPERIGRCPITGVTVRREELRRVLV